MITIKMLCTRDGNIPEGSNTFKKTFTISKESVIKNCIIRDIPLETCVSGTIGKEMSTSVSQIERLKAQAVLARTLLIQRKIKPKTSEYDITDISQFDQACDLSRIDNKTEIASKATEGEILIYKGEIIKEILYSSNNGGLTRLENVKQTWNVRDIPYYISTYDGFNQGARHGHGIGMSQNGAEFRARAGHSYKEILAFYYIGCVIIQSKYKFEQDKTEEEKEKIMIKNGYKICIDAGHGNETGGKRTPPLLENLYIDGELVKRKGEQIREHEFNSALRARLKHDLELCGFEVFTLSNGADISISNRKKLIKPAECDLSMSIHYNAGNSENRYDGANGLSAFLDNDGSPSDLSREYATKVLAELNRLTGFRVRGKPSERANLGMCNERDLGCPAILVEHGFMTSIKESRLMLDPKHHKNCSEAHTRVICELFKVEYVSNSDSDYNPDDYLPTFGEIKSYVVNSSDGNLYMHDKPGGRLVKKYYNGNIMINLETDGSWVHVQAVKDDKKGYMNAKYLDVFEYFEKVDEDPVVEEPDEILEVEDPIVILDPIDPIDPVEQDTNKEVNIILDMIIALIEKLKAMFK